LSKLEKVKRKLITENKLTSIRKTMDVIQKYLDKMTYSQLLQTLDYAETKKNKGDGAIIFIKLTKETIESREKEMSENAKM
jgi:hypothetical protein